MPGMTHRPTITATAGHDPARAPAPDTQPAVRGREDREHAYCIGCDYGPDSTWPASCCAPATHALVLDDAHNRPYETHYCPRHANTSGPHGPAFRYRSDADAAAAVDEIEAHLRRRTHANDLPAALDRLRAGAEAMR